MNRLQVGRLLMIMGVLCMLGTILLVLAQVVSFEREVDDTLAAQVRLAESEMQSLQGEAARVIAAHDELLNRILARIPSEQSESFQQALAGLPELAGAQEPMPTPEVRAHLSWGGIVVPLLMGLALVAAGMYLNKQYVPPKRSTTFSRRSTEPVPRLYRDLLAQPVDPIGDLHVWRMQAEQNPRRLRDGLALVRELERFLDEQCDVEMIGHYGQQVVYEPAKQIAVIEEIPPGKQVKVVAPGWKHKQDTRPLRYPRVR